MLGLGSWFGLSGNSEVDTSAGSKTQESEAKDIKLQRRYCGQVTEGSEHERTERANFSADFSMIIGDLATVFKRSNSNSNCDAESFPQKSEKQTSKRSRGAWGEVGREPEDEGCVIS